MTSMRLYFLVCVFVAALTFVVFSPTLGYDFVNWDDNIYVYQNSRLHPVTFENILWLFTHPYFRSWTPLSLFSHAIDVTLWQFNPFGHHLTNVILHSMNAALVFWLSLHVLTAFKAKGASEQQFVTSSVISGSVIAALLFALHPLRAESVAWISDRKDLLCAFFMLLTTIVYFTRREDPKRILSNYALLVSLYAFALGSKSVAMVLSVAFILLDVMLFKQKLKERLLEKIPLLLLAAGTGMMARLAAPELEKDFLVGDKTTFQLISFPFTATLFYLKNLIFPENLSPVYHTNAFLPSANSSLLILAPVVFLAVTIFCFIKMRQGRSYLMIAWSTFVMFVLPTFLGLLSGIQPVADRYTYFASISLCLLVGGGVERAFRPRAQEIFSFRSRLLLAVSVACLSLLSYKTLQQIKIWKDPMTLWTYVISRAPFPRAYNNFGMAQVEKRMYDEALQSFEKALKLRPDYGEAMWNMGIVYNKLGKTEKAIASYKRVIEIQPDYLDSYINLGTEYLNKGLVDSAIVTYKRALAVDSTFAKAYYNIALALMKQKKFSDAIVEHQKALALEPSNADVWYNLGVAYENQSQLVDAIASYTKAIGLRQDYLDAYINLGNALAAQGHLDKAIETLSKAISVNPESADAYYNLGNLFFYNHEVDKAFAAFLLAIKKDSTYANAYYNLGIIYGENGNEQEALAVFRRAAQLGSGESQELLRRKCFTW
ncbi:MAG: tetratricopeptide repeat protein [Bacteroidota bacterium]